jgi:hypothetical protein
VVGVAQRPEVLVAVVVVAADVIDLEGPAVWG